MRLLLRQLCVSAVLGAAMWIGSSADALAGPPSIGIDRGLVLTLGDRARRASFDKKQQAEGADAPSAFKKIRTIVIDPGHGGENQGALGVVDVHEKYLTIELAYALREELQRTYPDARVVLTRYWDTELSLNERAHMANRVDADVFLSLHYNSAPHPRAVGIETYYLSDEKVTPDPVEVQGKPLASARPTTSGIPRPDEAAVQGFFNESEVSAELHAERMRQHARSALLAKIVQRSMLKELKGSKNRGVKQANFGVLRGALMPAIVVEGGFLSHPEEGRSVAKSRRQRKLVRALVSAIVSFDDALAKQADDAGARAPSNEPVAHADRPGR